MKKRIGILTFHKSINTGAFIQSYSFAKRLMKDFPDCIVEIIDYQTRTGYERYSSNLSVVLKQGLSFNTPGQVLKSSLTGLRRMLSILLVKRYQMSDRKLTNALFEKAWDRLPLSDFSLITDDYNQLISRIYGIYDVVIVGSDCVWQYVSYPFPNAYLLHDDIGCTKVSYAACAYRINTEKMSLQDVQYLRESVNSLSYIGVRDEQTRNVLLNIGIKKQIAHNCDPAFLLNMESVDVDIGKLKEKMERYGVDFKRPIIGLQIRNKTIARMIRSCLSEKYQLVAIRERSCYADAFIKELNPFEWSRVFSFFSCTMTDYFHATLLSIKNGVCPVVFDNKTDFGEYEISRTEDLMNRVKLPDCYISYKRGEESEIDILSMLDKAKKVSEKCLLERVEAEMAYYDGFRDYLRVLLDKTG